jgi:transcription-repair coupling factor (superfamily II helicase)
VRTFQEPFPTSQARDDDFGLGGYSKEALVTFHEDKFPSVDGLLAYVERLDGTAKLRPDMKLVVARAFATPRARLNAAVQISRGLAKAAG